MPPYELGGGRFCQQLVGGFNDAILLLVTQRGLPSYVGS